MCAGPQRLSATARAGTWHKSTGEHSERARATMAQRLCNELAPTTLNCDEPRRHRSLECGASPGVLDSHISGVCGWALAIGIFPRTPGSNYVNLRETRTFF